MNNKGLRYQSVGVRLKSFGAIAFLALTSVVITAPRAQGGRITLQSASVSPPPISTAGASQENSGTANVDVPTFPTFPTFLNIVALNNLQGSGGGNVADIFRSAADRWEQSLKDDFVLTLNFGVADFSSQVTNLGLPDPTYVTSAYAAPITGLTNIDGILGLHIPTKFETITLSDGSQVQRETEGTILFNTNPSVPYFLDPTPQQSQEYGQFSDDKSNLGGGIVNIGRQAPASSSIDVSQGYDLYTVALHEIGHALGLSKANSSAVQQVRQDGGNISVTAPRPFVGTTIPTTYNTDKDIHIDPTKFPNTVDAPQLSQGIRKQLSCIDVLAAAQISQFNDVNQDSGGVCDNQQSQSQPKSVPEPSSLASLFGVAVALVASRKRLEAKPLNVHL